MGIYVSRGGLIELILDFGREIMENGKGMLVKGGKLMTTNSRRLFRKL